MKHKHTTTCEHEIKVCDCCDTAYCTKCDKEWGEQKPCNLNHWPTYIPYPVYPQPVIPTRRPYWRINCGSGYPPFGTFTATNVCDSSLPTLTTGRTQ